MLLFGCRTLFSRSRHLLFDSTTKMTTRIAIGARVPRSDWSAAAKLDNGVIDNGLRQDDGDYLGRRRLLLMMSGR